MEMMNKTHYSCLIYNHLFSIDASHSCAPPKKAELALIPLLLRLLHRFIHLLSRSL